MNQLDSYFEISNNKDFITWKKLRTISILYLIIWYDFQKITCGRQIIFLLIGRKWLSGISLLRKSRNFKNRPTFHCNPFLAELGKRSNIHNRTKYSFGYKKQVSIKIQNSIVLTFQLVFGFWNLPFFTLRWVLSDFVTNTMILDFFNHRYLHLFYFYFPLCINFWLVISSLSIGTYLHISVFFSALLHILCVLVQNNNKTTAVIGK